MTQILRLPFLHLMGCFSPDIIPSLFIQKIQIFLTYLAFSGGMCVLGRVLFQRHLSAVYLFAATLYAGFCMNALHSDQIISLIFWLPWAVSCAVLFHRNRYNSKGAWYLNGAVFFYSLAVLDEYPTYCCLSHHWYRNVYTAIPKRLFVVCKVQCIQALASRCCDRGLGVQL